MLAPPRVQSGGVVDVVVVLAGEVDEGGAALGGLACGVGGMHLWAPGWWSQRSIGSWPSTPLPPAQRQGIGPTSLAWGRGHRRTVGPLRQS